MSAYRKNVSEGAFAYTDEADKMFMEYLNKVKKGIPSSAGTQSSACEWTTRPRLSPSNRRAIQCLVSLNTEPSGSTGTGIKSCVPSLVP